MAFDLLVKDGLLVIPEAGIHKATLAIKGEKIVGIFENADCLEAEKVVQAEGHYVMPGIVQPHAHLGRLEKLEDYASETASAAIGGVTTTLIFHRDTGDYDLQLPEVIRTAARKAYTDFSLHLQVMSDRHVEKIPLYLEKYGISSYKFNMGYRGRESVKKGIIELNDGVMLAAFSNLSKMGKVVACIHAENSEINAYNTAKHRQAGHSGLSTWLEARPSISEAEGIHRALYFGGLTRCPLYFAHMTTRAGLELIREHRRQGLSPVYIETCPQYLTHDIDCGLGETAKFIPPLRTSADREALWQGLVHEDIDAIGVDQITRKMDPADVGIWERSTAPRESATLLPVLISEGHHRRGLSLESIARLTSYNPARIFNLYPKKGTLSVGSDADIVLVDIHQEKKVTPDIIRSASDYSVYDGWVLKGWPVLTLCRGKTIIQEGRIVADGRGWGAYISRKDN